MNFNNRENEKIELPDGRVIFLSRSAAVTGIVIVRVRKRWWQTPKHFVLTTVRGKDTPDFQGYRCAPCGYLDWDEGGNDAAMRETWEETNFNLKRAWSNIDYLIDPDKKKTVKFKKVYDKMSDDQPFHVSSRPGANKQNVTLSYGVVFEIKSVADLPVIDGRNVNKKDFEEVASADWTPLEEIQGGLHKFAFNHDGRILDFVNNHYRKPAPSSR